MELTVQNVYGLLLRSKLLSIDEAKAMFDRWQQESKDAANLAKFASWMAANKYLTEYQAQLLARGHADGFFLNEYKILDRLGKGRMAGVYKAQHHLGQIVAIKVLPPSKTKNANLLGRFHREARLALRLQHPNIVRTFHTGEAKGLHYIVMEYLQGETLEDVLGRRGKMPSAESVRLVYQALQGLQHIHDRGLVHRDVKPANMMLIGSTPDSTLRAKLKILDIGLGRMLFDETASEPSDDDLTREGVLLGTPDYMAPEQARDPRHIDIRADVYSAGCVLYHLLAGQPPFPDSNIVSQMIRHATEAPKPLKSFHAAVPDGLQQIVNWMMAKDAAQRYPTPERAAQALQVFLAAGSEQLEVQESDPHMRPYLTWLEGESGKQPSVAAPAEPRPLGSEDNRSLTVAAPPPPSSAKPPKLPKETRAADKHPKKKRRPPAVPAPSPPPVTEPVEQINVELVPLDLTAPAAEFVKSWRLTRRDSLIFSIGAVLGAVVTFVGFWLAFKK